MLWSKTEALRLALWLVSEADESFKEGVGNIEDAADNMIRHNLEKLWGKKLWSVMATGHQGECIKLTI